MVAEMLGDRWPGVGVCGSLFLWGLVTSLATRLPLRRGGPPTEVSYPSRPFTSVAVTKVTACQSFGCLEQACRELMHHLPDGFVNSA